MDQKIEQMLQQLTLQEKAALCSGSSFWYTKGVPRLKLEPVMLTDGPHGLRKQAGSADHLGLNNSVPATCFPAACTTACSFDPAMMEEMGRALAEECLQENVAVLLGPGVNIKRNPLCGRNFEYFSEDPYLAGKMAAGLIRGVESEGIGTSLKHFAVNNQEEKRLVINAVVDERALREIYLTPFEIAIKESNPSTVMCSYNRINGEYSSENSWLLQSVLREEWGFEGLVVSDWGAVNDRVKGISAGMDLEMPFVTDENDEAIVKAVQEGRLPMQTLDQAAGRILSLLIKGKQAKQCSVPYNKQAHHELAQKIAARSAVLLKNEDSLLPLSPRTKLALLGAFAQHPRYQGAGSSRIDPLQLDTLCTVFSKRGINYTYAPGYALDTDEAVPALIEKAKTVAAAAETALVCIGLPDAYESEGFDRDHMKLPPSHVALLKAVHEVNPNTVVLLFGGSVIQMPWLNYAKALLMMYLGGQAGAGAAAQLLFGDVCPSGKLAETFPLQLQDTPSFHYFPGDENNVEYRESLLVGYRYYDLAHKEVLFPFGFGLSYTQFSYGELTLTHTSERIIASISIKNIGAVSGSEIVQFYVGQCEPSIFRPLRELKGFVRIELTSGEEKNVTVCLDMRAFACYDVAEQAWKVPSGKYQICAAASSRDLRSIAYIELDGIPMKGSNLPAYTTPKSNKSPVFPDSQFYALFPQTISNITTSHQPVFDRNTTFTQAMNTRAGALLLQHFKTPGQDTEKSGPAEETSARMMQRILADMPLRGLAMLSSGLLTLKQIDECIAQMNIEKNEED